MKRTPLNQPLLSTCKQPVGRQQTYGREDFVRVEYRVKPKKKSNTTQHSPEVKITAQKELSRDISNKLLGGYIRQAKFLLNKKRHSVVTVSDATMKISGLSLNMAADSENGLSRD